MAGRARRGGTKRRGAEGGYEATYETLIRAEEAYPILDAVGALYGQAQRALYAQAHREGRTDRLLAFSPEYQQRFGLTRRWFSAIAIDLGRRVQSALGTLRRRIINTGDMIEDTRRQLEASERVAARLRIKAERDPAATHNPRQAALRHAQAFKMHNLRRRVGLLQDRLAGAKADLAAGEARPCFGGRRLLRHQHALRAAGFRHHRAWRAEWRRARSGRFVVVGTSGESAGNQTCQLHPDGTLRLRLPYAVEQAVGASTLTIPDIAFRYGGQHVRGAVAARRHVCYTFVRRPRKGKDAWYVQATVSVAAAPVITCREAGAVGADINPLHADTGEVDRCGNPLPRRAQRIPLRVLGRTREQVRASVSEAAKAVVAQAKAAGKPIALEDPDRLWSVRREMRYRSPVLARRMSAFASREFASLVVRRAKREGVAVLPPVDPSFTSAIGLGKFGFGYGLPSHEAASVAIARRGLGFGEAYRSRGSLTLPEDGAGQVRDRWTHASDWLRTVREAGRALPAPRAGARSALRLPAAEANPPSSAARAVRPTAPRGPTSDLSATGTGGDHAGRAVRPADMAPLPGDSLP